jgi:hypothetical protein
MSDADDTRPNLVTEIAEIVARLFESDPHQFSTRPCQTCRTVSAILNRPFGCSALRDAKVKQ